jgi:hypothetical protein
MLKNLEKLPKEVEKILKPYCEEMVKIHKENLLSMLVYGSAVGRDFISKKSNINLVFVFNNLKREDLDKSLKLVNKGRRKRIIAPLFLTDEYMRSSSDVFPIEFLEMKENHILIYGEDFLERLEISRENLRLQCEQQLKGKLIRLRQAYLEIGKNRKAIMQLIWESFTSFIPVIRNLLRLKEGIVLYDKEELLVKAAEHLGVEFDLFKMILYFKSKGKIPSKAKLKEIFSKYMEEIFKLAMLADKL